MDYSKQDITRFLRAAYDGDKEAEDKLWKLIHEEIQRIAHRELQNEHKQRTLNTLALVSEAYERLVDQNRITWQNRNQFYAIACQIMRRILIDRGRKRQAAKRGSDPKHRPLEDALTVAVPDEEALRVLLEALEQLSRYDPRLAQVVEYRYFRGYSEQETAQLLNVGLRTVQRDWKRAKAYLKKALCAEQGC